MTSGSKSTRPSSERVIVWRPQSKPQKALVDCPLPEVFFGGARGGGKTDGVLGKWALKEKRYGPKFNAIMFRRTTVSSEDAIERSKDIYKPLGGKYNESKLIWRMPNGGRVAFGVLTTSETLAGSCPPIRNLVTDVASERTGSTPLFVCCRPSPILAIRPSSRISRGTVYVIP